MYEWSGGIFAKKTKFHDAGGPGTVVSPSTTQIFNGRFLCVYKPFVSCDESRESIYFPAARWPTVTSQIVHII